MLSARKQGKNVHSEVQEVIASLVKLCDEEGRRKQLTFPLTVQQTEQSDTRVYQLL
jgi:hypothetical protein